MLRLVVVGEVVAQVRKQVHVRLKRRAPAPLPTST